MIARQGLVMIKWQAAGAQATLASSGTRAPQAQEDYTTALFANCMSDIFLITFNTQKKTLIPVLSIVN